MSPPSVVRVRHASRCPRGRVEANRLAAVTGVEYVGDTDPRDPTAMLMIPRRAALATALSFLCAVSLVAQTHITTPKEEFGANFGDDYFLANYKQIAAYWRKLD